VPAGRRYQAWPASGQPAVADTGDYSDDGTLCLAFSTNDPTGQPSDLCRYRLSLTIARAVQASLPVLAAASESVHAAEDDALRIA
jgi:hypothetical protein